VYHQVEKFFSEKELADLTLAVARSMPGIASTSPQDRTRRISTRQGARGQERRVEMRRWADSHEHRGASAPRSGPSVLKSSSTSGQMEDLRERLC
jgi:hypothetical protein